MLFTFTFSRRFYPKIITDEEQNRQKNVTFKLQLQLFKVLILQDIEYFWE